MTTIPPPPPPPPAPHRPGAAAAACLLCGAPIEHEAARCAVCGLHPGLGPTSPRSGVPNPFGARAWGALAAVFGGVYLIVLGIVAATG